MKEDTVTTSERIIVAARELFQENGFHAVSMKHIACRAGVSEMTVFRHFSSKKQVLEEVIRKISYIPRLQDVFEGKINWTLESDLLLISEAYQKIMMDNQLAFLITLREEKTIPEISEFIRQGPPQLKVFLKNYFHVMAEKRKIQGMDIESLALAFMAINFGYFFFKVCGQGMVAIHDDQYLKTAVGLFARGVKA